MDRISMQFSLNQAVLNTAIAAALPSLLKELEFDYVSGRAPKGLQATVTVTEAMIRKAVENYARRTVNASFTHFGIEFQATRGEDGIVANITASNEPIQPEEPKAALVAQRDAAQASADKAAASAAVEPKAAPVEEPAAVADEPADEVVDEAPSDAPFDTDEQPADEVQVEVPADEAVADKAATAAPAPAAGRSKLFADLKRPSNEPSA